jgi:hypothetical protein
MSHENCPKCGESGTVEGRLNGLESGSIYFVPDGVPWWWPFSSSRWIISADDQFSPKRYACPTCGCFWGQLPPAALREVVELLAARTKKPAPVVKGKTVDPDLA